MTSEGVIMIIILSFALLKIIQYRNYYREKISFKKLEFSKSSAETLLFFALSVGIGMSITNQIIGLILLNTIVWMVYHSFLQSLGYSIISWLSLIIFWVYLYASYITFDAVPFTEIWYYSLLMWEVSFLFIFLYDTFGKHIKILPAVIAWLVSSILLLIPLGFIVYKHSFDTPMEEGQINAIYQTNSYEALEFIQVYIPFNWPVLVLISLVGLFIFLLRQEFILKKRIGNSVFLYMTAGLLLLANLNVPQNLLLPKFIIQSAEAYAMEVELFKKEQENRKLGNIKIDASKIKGKEIYVVVIGESLNKDNMSLYGYHRNTTPRLDELYRDSAIIKFEEAFSNHVHTVPVLLQSLTTSNQLNGEKFSNSISILDIMERADFDTYWLSNQVAYGAWDNPVSVLAERADHRFNFNTNVGKITNTIVLDEMLAEKLEEILSKDIQENTAIFIHLMGNHADYQYRYSKDFEKYTGDLEKKFFGSKEYLIQYLNPYDNSILYNDYVISRMINVLQKKGGISAFLYFADHSEDVLGNKGHNVGNFSFPMIQTPMIMWVSDAYKEMYKEKYSSLKSHTHRLFSNDFIYELLIGMTGITSTHYNAVHDLSNPSYDLPLEDCFTLHGQRKIDDPENLFYHQRRNTFFLDSLNLLSKVYPHRVNTIGKLKTIFYNGNNSFEVDVIFRQEKESGYFEVGHDEGALSGMKLEELLSYATENNFQKVWLDVKNLNDENISAITQRLTELNDKFNIKEKFIVESGTTSSAFANISKAGFHTSYYLPTDIKNTDKKGYQKIAASIAQQVQKQQVKAVSFDIGLYSFVKEHLEKLIPNDIVYHTWDLSLQLKDPNFKDNLLNRPYFNDSRIKSVLVGYQSDFEL